MFVRFKDGAGCPVTLNANLLSSMEIDVSVDERPNAKYPVLFIIKVNFQSQIREFAYPKKDECLSQEACIFSQLEKSLASAKITNPQSDIIFIRFHNAVNCPVTLNASKILSVDIYESTDKDPHAKFPTLYFIKITFPDRTEEYPYTNREACLQQERRIYNQLKSLNSTSEAEEKSLSDAPGLFHNLKI